MLLDGRLTLGHLHLKGLHYTDGDVKVEEVPEADPLVSLNQPQVLDVNEEVFVSKCLRQRH